ncbi:MAG: hypothetical protein V4604_02985 [Bacteroidota bacterium]
MKNQKTTFVRKGAVTFELDDSTRLDMKIFETCGDWDDIDKKIFEWPNILTISLDYCDIGEDETYGQILYGVMLYKLTDEYKLARNKVMLEAEFSEGTEKKPETANSNAELVIEPAQKKGVFYKLNDLPSAIEAGKLQQKRVLIYFTGWLSVNSRKLEDRVLIDKGIQVILAENYLCFSAYTDEKTNIPGSTVTIGEKNAKIQLEQFKSYEQPCFYILDENGSIISCLQYAISVSSFEAFLKEGLK